MPAADPTLNLRLRSIVLGLLSAGTIAAPLCWGATEVWGYCALQILGAIAAAIWLRTRPRTWPLLWLPICVFGLGLAQAVPLPPAIVELLAPLTFKTRQTAEEIARRPINGGTSLDTARTLDALRRCLLPALIVVIVGDIARHERSRRTLLICMASSGVIILLLGLAIDTGDGYKAMHFHDRAGSYRDYKNPLLSGLNSEGMGHADAVDVGGVPYVSNAPIVSKPYGVMLNANHFAACVGLTVPIIVGLLVALRFAANWPAWALPLVGVAYCLSAGYAVAIVAHSRGGILAMLVSGVVVGACAFATTRRRVWVLFPSLALVAVVFGALAWQRGLPRLLGGRLIALQAAGEMFVNSPWLGIGLGNYGVAYPAFSDQEVWYLAHNTWLEWAAETGLVGVLLLVGAMSVGVWKCALRRTSLPLASSPCLRLGMLGALAFAAAYAAADWCLQVPANAWLCAVLVGCLWGDLHSAQKPQERAPPDRELDGMSLSFVSGTLATGLFCLLLSIGALREILADRWMTPLRRAIALQHLPEILVRPLRLGASATEKQSWQQSAHRAEEGRPQLIEERRELLSAPLLAGIRAAEMFPESAEYAGYVAQAYLHQSRGIIGPEFRSAHDWFCRSLQLSPINPWTRRTLEAMDERIGLQGDARRDSTRDISTQSTREP